MRRASHVLVVLVCLQVAACAATIQKGAVASKQAAQLVENIQTAETEIYNAGTLSLDQHQWWATMFVGIADGITAINAGLRAGHTPSVHSAVEGTLAFVDGMVTELDVFDDERKVLIQVLLSTLRSVLVALSVI